MRSKTPICELTVIITTDRYEVFGTEYSPLLTREAAYFMVGAPRYTANREPGRYLVRVYPLLFGLTRHYIFHQYID